MNVLLLAPQPPLPAHQGTALRNWGILRHLAPHHAVALVCFASGDAAAPPPDLLAACRSVERVPRPRRGLADRLRTAMRGQADLSERLWSPDFARTVQRVLAADRFDIVQVEGLELGAYVSRIRRSCPEVPIVFDAHNAEVTIQERAWHTDRGRLARWPAAVYSRLQLPRLARFEADVCREADAVTCVSEADAAALRALVPDLQPVIIANGIDLADYRLPASEQPSGEVLTFTGKMDYRPNADAALWFVEGIWPRIRQRRPSARFQVVGQRPAAVLRRHDGQNGVAVIGEVPDIRPHIARASVYVAPLRMGGGTRFKLLEAMALGRAVVSTPIGAEGFDVQSGRELLIAGTAEHFAEAVLNVLDDPALARRLGQAGRHFVEAGYDWATITPRLEALHLKLNSRSARR